MPIPNRLPVPSGFLPDLDHDSRSHLWARRVAILHYSQAEVSEVTALPESVGGFVLSVRRALRTIKRGNNA